MEHRYPLFVAYAALAANTHLKLLLDKYKIAPSIEVITDAAKLGQQQAFERLFPGLIRLPFEKNPLHEIILAIRYEYEDDPEHLALEVGFKGGLSESQARPRYEVARSSRSSDTNVPELPQRPKTQASDTGVRMLRPATPPIPERIPTGASDSAVRQLNPSRTEVPVGIQPTKLSQNPTRVAIFPWEKKR